MAMAPRHRRRIPDSPSPESEPSSGLFSHVLSFVSREFESFLVNATGGPASQHASTRRVKSSGRRRGRGPDGNMSEDEARLRPRIQHRKREGRSIQTRPKPRSKSTESARRYVHNHVQLKDADDHRALSASDRERSKSPTPQPPPVFLVPPLPKLKKQPSITMPGSLFPRSPSLLPDQPNRVQCTQTSAATDPLRSSYPLCDINPGEAGPSSTHASTVPSTHLVDSNQSSLDQYVSPWRTRSVASVKDAVKRFNATEGVEAEFSLMLPSPHSSPAKLASKARPVGETSPHRPTSSTALPLSTSSKGKERMHDTANDTDLDFIVRGNSGNDGSVHAKERELDAAREEQREHERRLGGDQSRRASDERERDKRRIIALEEEVRWLKEELSRSQIRHSPPPSLSMPPPPPPPPPPPLLLRIDTTPYTPTSMFASARASLRHAMTPIEAPINEPALIRTKRRGQPTVNIPSEKMAAFLHEIKTAKLRRVASGVNVMGGDGVAGPSGLSKSVNVTSSASTGSGKLSAKELLRRRSLASLRVPIGSSLAAPVPSSVLAAWKEPEVRVGQKRKADALGLDEAKGAPPKRRITETSFQSSMETSQSTATSSSEISTISSLSLPSGPPHANETDVTTPSLCSDNDRDENSIEDRVPSTPPGPQATTATQRASGANTRGEQINVIDVDMEEDSYPAISNSVSRRRSDLFRKRPPTSPISIPTPRRPSAPARTKRGATPRPKSHPSLESDVEDEDEDEDEAPGPVPFISLIPVVKSKHAKAKAKPTLTGKGRRTVLQKQNDHSSTSLGSGSSAQSKRKKGHKRRQTLDEELRSVEARFSDSDQCNDELEPNAKEEDVFIATGTKSSKRGFLAHGGAGGAPVFMGMGYVQGATLDSGDEDGPTGMRPSLKSTSRPTSLLPRPKARR